MPRSRFAMLRACRAARFGRVLLLAAAILAVAGSFGLHPEPLAENGVASSAAPEWSAGASADAATHGCMACLAHRSVSLGGLAVFVPASNTTLAPPPSVPVEPVRILASRTVDGRAPPLSA